MRAIRGGDLPKRMPHMDDEVPLRAKSDVVARRLGDAVVLVNLATNRIYELNATGARIWELLSEGRQVAEIARVLEEEFESEGIDIQREIEDLVARARAEGLVDDGDDR
jgi:hypothetical protein